ncbi:MAG TPA: hypothetical protein VJP40_08890, partial [bacterium]|nr:hypothetical protein [bacterium]
MGALLIAALLFRRDNRNANLLLCLILAAALLYQYSQMDRLLNPLPAPAYIWGTGFVVSLLIPTLVFLYVLVLTVPGFRWRSSLLVHFIPALVGLGVVAFAKLVLMRYAFAYDPDFRAWFRFFCIVFDVIISGLYFFASYRQIQDYRSQMELFFSQLRRVRLQWLRILLLIVVLPWLIQVFDVLSGPSVRLEYIMVPLITALFLL